MDLGRGAGEEAAAGKHLVAEMVDERVGERQDRRQAGLGGVAPSDDDLVEDVLGGVDGRELKLLLRAEMGVEAALAHPDLVGELPDREPVDAAR